MSIRLAAQVFPSGLSLLLLLRAQRAPLSRGVRGARPLWKNYVYGVNELALKRGAARFNYGQGVNELARVAHREGHLRTLRHRGYQDGARHGPRFALGLRGMGLCGR